MFDILTTPRGPNPTEIYKLPPGPPQGKWILHRSRRKREKEVYQDYKRFPWRGERQAQTDPPRTALLGAMLDLEMRRVPAKVRQALPRSGVYPTVVDYDPGPGPNPFLAPPENPDELQARLNTDKPYPGWKPDPKWDLSKVRNPADYHQGPYGKRNIWDTNMEDLFTKGGLSKEFDRSVRRLFGIDDKVVEEDGDPLPSSGRGDRPIRIPTRHRHNPNNVPPPVGNLGPHGGAVPGGGLNDPVGLPVPGVADPHRPPNPRRRPRPEDDDDHTAEPPRRRHRHDPGLRSALDRLRQAAARGVRGGGGPPATGRRQSV